MLTVLTERAFECETLRLFASSRSAGEKLPFGEKEFVVEDLATADFSGIDIALFSAGGETSKEYAHKFVEAGAVVIDNSSQFRMDEGVPLVVPEVNADSAREVARKGKGIIANPNCSTIQLVVALKPIAERFGLKRVVVSTYQSVSGAGKVGMDELWNQSVGIFNQKPVEPSKFSKQIAFNCIPHCDVFLENGYTKEEMKLVNESRKILNLPNLRLTATAVRVPVFLSHSEAVNVELEKSSTQEELKALLRESPGCIVLDDPSEEQYPTAVDTAGTDATFIGRIRKDETLDSGYNLWIVADNLRKGAALNAVQIAEIVAAEPKVH
ncbi:UNVERIFIED_CONTAM: hypothetical protein GTU68_038007 [Idotea baltica]|nr:hypothetical protein [Idotea baltica]